MKVVQTKAATFRSWVPDILPTFCGFLDKCGAAGIIDIGDVLLCVKDEAGPALSV